jgi:hypothetical protein
MEGQLGLCLLCVEVGISFESVLQNVQRQIQAHGSLSRSFIVTKYRDRSSFDGVGLERLM